MDRNQREGLLYVGAAVLGYSFLPIISKRMLEAGFPPLDIAFWRFIFATPAFWLLILVRRVPKPDKPLPRKALLILGSLLAAAAIIVFVGLQYLPASTYIVLFYTYPVMVAVISALLGERLPTIGWVALTLTLIGVILTVPDLGGIFGDLGGNNALGLMFALVNALVVAVYFVVNERVLRGHKAMARASGWITSGALIVMLVTAGIRRDVMLPLDREMWAALITLALFCTVLPVFALANGIQKLGSSRAAIMGTFEPVFTLIWSMLLLKETMLPMQVVGGIFILSSVILLQTQNRAKLSVTETLTPASAD